MKIACIADASNDQEGRQHDGCLSVPQRLLFLIRYCVRTEASGFRLRLRFCRGKVRDEKQREDRHEDHGGQGIHGRLDAAAHLTVDQGGKCIDPGAPRKVGDDKVVERHRKRHQKAR